MLSERRLAPESCHVARKLTPIPTSATTRITAPSASGGETSSAAPFAWAERISERRNPKVRFPPAGCAARRSTTSDTRSAPASVSMCAASDRSASESARMPATTPPAMKSRIRPSAIAIRRASPLCSCECACPCTRQSCRRAHHLAHDRLRPLGRPLELARLQWAGRSLDEEALGLGDQPVAPVTQPARHPVGGRADEQRRLVRAGVEHGNRRPSQQRQPLDPAAGADPDLAVASSLVDRGPARTLTREAVDLRRRAEDDQADVVKRGERVVDREELDLSLGGECLRDLLGDLPRVAEP